MLVVGPTQETDALPVLFNNNGRRRSVRASRMVLLAGARYLRASSWWSWLGFLAAASHLAAHGAFGPTGANLKLACVSCLRTFLLVRRVLLLLDSSRASFFHLWNRVRLNFSVSG